MKKYFLINFFVLFIVKSYCQQYVIETLESKISDSTIQKLKNKVGVTKYTLCKFNKLALNSDIVRIKLFDKQEIIAKKRYVDKRSTNNFSWFGKGTDGITDVIFTVIGETLTAMVANNTERYFINQYKSELILTKFDASLVLVPECITGNKEVSSIKPENDIKIEHDTSEKKFTSIKSSKRYDYNNQVIGDFKCKLRIIIFYTYTAEQSEPNILGTAQLAVDQLNVTFMNSNINYMAELACATYTNSTASSSGAENIMSIVDANDGDFDEFEEKRKACGADVIVLFCGAMTGIRGQAAGFKVCRNRAIAVVHHYYATSTYTFTHEMGHLFGCRHEFDADPTSTPFSYGHGLCYERYNPDNWFRTMMAVACPFEPARVLHFSNPDVNWGPQSVSTGGNSANNAKVIRDNIDNMISFRSKTGNREVYNSDINSNSNVIYHPNEISTIGNISIPNTTPLGFMAGNVIYVNEGFTTDDNSEVTFELVEQCGTPDNLYCNYDTSGSSDGAEDKLKILPTVGLYPNPFQDKINITSEMGITTIYIFSIEGKKVFDKIIDKTPNFVEIDLTHLSMGNYIVKILYANQTYNYKKITKL